MNKNKQNKKGEKMKKMMSILLLAIIFFNCSGDESNPITKSQKDTLYISSKPNLDSIYNSLIDSLKQNYYSDVDSIALMDSIQNRATSILDSSEILRLKDSIYNAIYGGVKEEISKSAIEDITIWYEHTEDKIYTPYIQYIDSLYKEHEVFGYVYYAIIKNNASYSYNEDKTYHISIEVEIPGYSNTATKTITIEPGETDTIKITPILKYSKLDSIREVVSTEIKVKMKSLVSNNEVLFYSNSFPTELSAIDVAYLSVMTFPNGDTINYHNYIPIWSTPNIPEIQNIIHKASLLNDRGSIGGYQGDVDTDKIKNEVKSIYDALQDMGINYVNNAISFTHGQKIKFPKDVLETGNANCIDGSMLYIAIFEAIGLNPVLVDIPGHAFVGWETWDGSGEYDYLETTLTWGSSSFDYANSRGVEEYNDESDNGNFTSGASIISNIKELREKYFVRPAVLSKKLN